jgi:hypothetical protein
MFMRVPEESLDDFRNIDAVRKPAAPPPVKFLRPSGRFEVLKPLARPNDLGRPDGTPAARRLSWYHRSVAFSVGLAVIALIVGIVAGIYAPPEPAGFQSDLVMDRQPDDMPAFSKEPEGTAPLPATNASSAFDKPYAVRSTARRRLSRPSFRYSSYRPRRFIRPSLFVMSSFVPTTLIIYIENGEIKSRIEPQLAANRKKS